MSGPKVPAPRIDVVELATGEVVHSMRLSNTGERYIQRVLLGMLRNLDTERFALAEVFTETKS